MIILVTTVLDSTDYGAFSSLQKVLLDNIKRSKGDSRTQGQEPAPSSSASQEQSIESSLEFHVMWRKGDQRNKRRSNKTSTKGLQHWEENFQKKWLEKQK